MLQSVSPMPSQTRSNAVKYIYRWAVFISSWTASIKLSFSQSPVKRILSSLTEKLDVHYLGSCTDFVTHISTSITSRFFFLFDLVIFTILNREAPCFLTYNPSSVACRSYTASTRPWDSAFMHSLSSFSILRATVVSNCLPVGWFVLLLLQGTKSAAARAFSL